MLKRIDLFMEKDLEQLLLKMQDDLALRIFTALKAVQCERSRIDLKRENSGSRGKRGG